MDIFIEKNVPVRMRDGVVLATDVLRPQAPGPFPTLVQRLPYDKERAWLRDSSVDLLRLVQGGYAVVNQDTRGCGASEGRFRPFLDDQRDGVWSFKRADGTAVTATYKAGVLELPHRLVP